MPHRADEQQFIAGLHASAAESVGSRHAALAIPALAFQLHSAARNPLIATSFIAPSSSSRARASLEIRGVEPFGKPGEDVVQQLAGVTFLALTLPQSSKAHCRAQFQ